MHRTRIQICGVCRAADATAAAFAGADAIGLVFHRGSPRCVTIEQAKQIIAGMPAFVSVIGLFVDAGVAEIREVAGKLGLSAVQLHGGESPAMVAELGPIRVVKAMEPDIQELDRWRNVRIDNMGGLMLETAATGVPGGSGVANDWEGIAKLKTEGKLEGLGPIILAGGLTPETVGDVVRRFAPYGVDVSSGVEVSRGEKSAEKMAAFIKAVHKADHDLVPHKKHA